MIEGKTRSGFKFKVDENTVNDWDFMRRMSRLNAISKKAEDPEDGAAQLAAFEEIDSAFQNVLGEKQFENLLSHIRKQHNGCAKPDVVMTEWQDIISAAKNSSSSDGS